jgi:hypothetical protein
MRQTIYTKEKRVFFVVEYKKPEGEAWFKWTSCSRLAEAEAEVTKLRSAHLLTIGAYPLRILRQDVVATSYIVKEVG